MGNGEMGAVAIIAGLVVFLVLLVFLPAWLLCWLWNGWVVPGFGAPVLAYWQAFVAIFILSLIFKGSSSSTKGAA